LANGLRSARAAGMAPVAVPNPDYPPSEDALGLAAVSVNSIVEVTPELVQGLAL
jgi:beta-phosphoglucomutase-like phosphatase (HAD superfamily)